MLTSTKQLFTVSTCLPYIHAQRSVSLVYMHETDFHTISYPPVMHGYPGASTILKENSH